MLSYLLAFITFVCSHAQCSQSAIDYNPDALSYWIQQYADATQDQARKLLQDDAPPQ